VDVEKAYDSVDWSFLEYMLRRMGFVDKWVSWMTACVCGDPCEWYTYRRDRYLKGPKAKGSVSSVPLSLGGKRVQWPHGECGKS